MPSASSRIGTDGYCAVYQLPRGRLAGAMLLLAATILTAPAVSPIAPQRQATATVRIVRAEPVRFQDIERQAPSLLRSTVVRTRDGRTEPARLLEYQ